MIVNYCYSDYIKLTEFNIKTYLSLAYKYQFESLIQKCILYCTKMLNVDNVVEILLYAYECSYTEIQQSALNFVCKHFEAISMQKINTLNFPTFRILLRSDYFVSTEALIFDRLMKWSKGKDKNHTYLLLHLIRLHHIDLKVSIFFYYKNIFIIFIIYIFFYYRH